MPAAIPLAIVAAGAGAAAIQGNAAKGAAAAQGAAADKAANAQLDMYNTSQHIQQPYVTAGKNAIAGLSPYTQIGTSAEKELGGIYGLPGYSPVNLSKILPQLPGYQFQLQQGENALNSNLAARGLAGSGLAAKELTQFGQGTAADYLGSYLGGLQGLAGQGFAGLQGIAQLGQASAGNQAAAGIQTGRGLSDTYGYAGNAAATGQIGQANAYSGLLNNLGGLGYAYFNRPQNPSSYAPPQQDPTGQYAVG